MHVELSSAHAHAGSDAPASILTRRIDARRDIVVLKGVRKSFGDTEVLRGIDLVCRHGETTCIVGGSGAGKTTLLRLVVALEKPTSGSIYIDGEDIVPMARRELNRVRQKFGMVYQYAALLDSITVLDNVAFPLVEHTKLSKAEIRQRVVDKLQILGLDESVARQVPRGALGRHAQARGPGAGAHARTRPSSSTTSRRAASIRSRAARSTTSSTRRASASA